MSLEYQAILNHFAKAAQSYDENAVLQKEINFRLTERLGIESLEKVSSVLDVGCGTGSAHQEILELLPKAELTGLDFSLEMLSQNQKHHRVKLVQSDCHNLPFADNQFDVVYSNMLLHWSNENEVLKESLRVLKPGGLLLFSCLGETTLFELKEAISKVKESTHVHSFPALHKLGDELMKIGFQDIVVNTEVLTLTYKNLKALLKDIKLSGGQNALENRKETTFNKSEYKELEQAYEVFRNNDDNRLPASYEVVYLRAVKAPLEKNAIPLSIK